MKKTFILFLFTVLILGDIILLIKLNTKINENNRLKLSFQTSSEVSQRLKNRLDNILINLSLTFELQSRKIDDKTTLYDENDKNFSITQVIRKNPMLVFKYSYLSCDLCIVEQIGLLKKVKERIGLDNILILTNYNSFADLSRFKRVNQIDMRIFNLKNNEFTQIDKNIPYYFILDESFSLKHFYIPIKGDTLLTKEYFNKIAERYF